MITVRSFLIGLITLLWLAATSQATMAQTVLPPAEAAQAALAELNAASDQLRDAEKSRDRVAALTATVRAYETGLEAVRDGLRRVAAQEAILSRDLESREEEIADLLGMISRIEASPTPIQLLHPQGPIGAARSAMLLAEITPTLQAQARVIQEQSNELHILRSLQQNAIDTLRTGLQEVQTARTALSQAIADRVDLPQRFAENADQMAQLAASAQTLDQFTNAIAAMPRVVDTPDPAAISANGTWPMPVNGLILRRFNQPDAAGISRAGWIVATHPNALVSSPITATIRYLGPLMDFGSVVILEPRPDLMIVISGMGTVFGAVGDVVSSGDPLGLMGEHRPEMGAIVSTVGEGGGNIRSETLYIEVRENGEPVNPEEWFTVAQDG